MVQKVFIYFIHYFAVASFGAFGCLMFEYGVCGDLILGCLLAILLAVGSFVALKLDTFETEEQTLDEELFEEEEAGDEE